jgi:hypothetical protein
MLTSPVVHEELFFIPDRKLCESRKQGTRNSDLFSSWTCTIWQDNLGASRARNLMLAHLDLGERTWVRIPLESCVAVCLSSVCVVLCADSDFATGWYPVQGVLATAFRITKLKMWPRSEGLLEPWKKREGMVCTQ